MHFAMITLGASGHVFSSLPMIAELVKKGNRVTYFTVPRYKEMVETIGADYKEVRSALTNNGQADKDIATDMMAELPLRFLSEGAATIESIMEVLRQDKPDAVIVDAIAIAGRLAAAELKVPMIMLFTSFAANDKFSLCRHWPVYPDTHPARAKAKELATELAAKYGTPVYDVYSIFEGTGDLNIVTQPASFHPAAATFDDSFVFAGPQIMKRVDSGTWEAPEGDAPLMYTSLGTLFNAWPAFYHILYGVVKDMNLRVVSSVGSTLTKEEIGEIPANVRTFSFLPQLEVLENADFFITHAGIGSVMEAAYYGVPMLAIPQMDEQAFTAKCMVDAGLGIMIPKEELTPERLREAIHELTTNPVYAENVKKMSAELQKLGGAYAAEKVMEFMANRA